MKDLADIFPPLPQIIGLNDGGEMKYLTEEKIKNKPKILKKYKYFLIGIGSQEKGPMYATVKAKDLSLSQEIAEFILTLEGASGYYYENFHTGVTMDSIHKRYSLMPMIYQYINYGLMSFSDTTFNDEFIEDIPELTRIQIRINERYTDINTFDVYDGAYDLRDIFSTLDLETISDLVFYDKTPQYMLLIPNKNKFEIIENRTRKDRETQILNMMKKLNAPYVIIPLYGIETVYLLSFYQLFQLANINYLSLSIREVGVGEDIDVDYDDFEGFYETAIGDLDITVSNILEWIIGSVIAVQNLYLYCCSPGSTTFDGLIRFRVNSNREYLYAYLPPKAFPNIPLFYVLDKIIS